MKCIKFEIKPNRGKRTDYANVHKILEGDKLCCSDESDLYKLEKELNEMGYKTRIGRNMYSGVLSIAILEAPNEVNDGK